VEPAADAERKADMTVKDFIRHNYRHFNAAVVVDASEAYLKHLASGGKMFMTLAGAMSTAELGLSLAEMIRQDKVHAICTTGANLEEDIFNLVAHNHYERVPHYRNFERRGRSGAARTRDEPRDRHVHSGRRGHAPDRAPSAEALAEADTEKQRYFPYEFMYQLIRGCYIKEFFEIDPKDSWVIAACEKNLRFLRQAGRLDAWEYFRCQRDSRRRVQFHVVKSGVEQMAALIEWYPAKFGQGLDRLLPDRGGHRGDFPIAWCR